MPAKKKPAATPAPKPKQKLNPPTPPAPVATPKPRGTEVKISAAKGRPMLQWVGKRPLRSVTAFPAQLVETFDPLGQTATAQERNGEPTGPLRLPVAPGLLFHGDNKEVLAYLLANGFRGKVNLIYIDPPFDSGADYVRKVTLRGKAALAKVEGEGYTLGEQVQYTDIWANDNYLQFMYERLILLKELLANDGSLYLHCDWNKSHYLRCLLEEVFGSANLRNEIVWQRTASRNDAKSFGHVHDTVFYVSKTETPTWNPPRIEYDEEYLARYYTQDDGDGRKYAPDNLLAAGLRAGSSGRAWRGFDPAPKGCHWKFATERLDELDSAGRIYWPKGGAGFPRYKRYVEDMKGKLVSTVWDDIFVVNSQAEERGDYPTQKPESLLDRIVSASSNPNDLILDCFLGSGTTAAVAQKLGRRWIGADINKGAIQTTTKRMQAVMADQLADAKKRAAQVELIADENAAPEPAQLSFAIHRVNDYDLQIQHNEAVALACEHIGVQRTKTDRYFDGTQGKRLVKIVPFNHPLSPSDLEELRTELKSRRDEERDILLVALGKELACDAWLTEWNRLRRKGDVPNKLEIIELRTDAKYGKFFERKPAKAKVKITRKNGELQIAIEDFVSPSILERLASAASLLTPQVHDWRSLVDSVMIDPAFDGKVFHIALTDLPEKKTDFVQGTYTLPAPKGETTVAVKITDMLGEETVVQAQV